jgi:hypothetical protein
MRGTDLLRAPREACEEEVNVHEMLLDIFSQPRSCINTIKCNIVLEVCFTFDKICARKYREKV